jgi:hypothetical protein
MRLRAKIRRATGNTRHFRGHIEGSEVVKDGQLPIPAWVEIEPRDGAFYLFYFDSSGECLTDTWHESLARAKDQAHFEFEIEEGDWEEVSGT